MSRKELDGFWVLTWGLSMGGGKGAALGNVDGLDVLRSAGRLLGWVVGWVVVEVRWCGCGRRDVYVVV